MSSNIKTSKENKGIHGRDVAISIYNQLCDHLGIPEDKRIESELTENQIEELEEMNLSENEKLLKIEKTDTMREVIIQGIRKKILVLDESNRIVQTLLSPIINKEGKILHSELVWKEDYDFLTFENNAKNIDPETNQIGMMRAMIASRTGVNRVMIGKLNSKDLNYAQALNSFFQTADSRI